jgi:hypothetical protein
MAAGAVLGATSIYLRFIIQPTTAPDATPILSGRQRDQTPANPETGETTARQINNGNCACQELTVCPAGDEQKGGFRLKPGIKKAIIGLTFTRPIIAFEIFHYSARLSA